MQVEFREIVLSIRDEILQSLGHPLISALGSRAARKLDLSHESVGVVLIRHGAPWEERCNLATYFIGSAQMTQMQATMKDSMAKMEAADAAMKSHMETQQAIMKSEMELKHSMMDQMQMLMDHMQQMTDRMAAMSDNMDMHKKTGKARKKDSGMMKDQKQ